MTSLTERKKSFINLGKFLSDFCQKKTDKKRDLDVPEEYFERLQHLIQMSKINNPWFTEENIFLSLESWAEALTKSHIDQWLVPYEINSTPPKTIALIAAGNLPMVGFHDLLCVLICGHKAVVKQSSKDKFLMPFMVEILEYFESALSGQVVFTEEKLTDFDAVIATGSNNTSRYFEYYFRNKPHIIRKNRTSVAVLSGNETKEQLSELGKDIFCYFGMGCRNVSKIYIPENYDLNLIFNALYDYHPIINHDKYANNYDYHKAIYLMNGEEFLDNGFLMLKKEVQLHSPTAVSYYEYYGSELQLKETLKVQDSDIQCIVSHNFIPNEVPFGKTQQPQLWDYADGVDTVNFLLKI